MTHSPSFPLHNIKQLSIGIDIDNAANNPLRFYLDYLPPFCYPSNILCYPKSPKHSFKKIYTNCLILST